MRRALVMVHLWLGVALALYIVVMSLTGSAVVARRELTRLWVPDVVAAQGRVALDDAALRAQAQARYPRHDIARIYQIPVAVYENRAAERFVPYPQGTMAAPVEITFERDGVAFTRRFDPYSGRDMGALFPPGYRALMWLVDLHNDLAGGRTGRKVNGWLALATTLLLCTGLAVWWPAGARRWRASIGVRRGVPRATLLRQLHNTAGFWPFLLLLLWSTSGIYFAFPEPFHGLLGSLLPSGPGGEDTADLVLAWFSTLHFGRFGGMGVRVAWIVAGLVPALLAVTGVWMWWYKTVGPALRGQRRRAR